MKLGVRAHDFGRIAPDEQARAISAAGFSCVQFAPTKGMPGVNHFQDVTIKALEEIAAAYAKHEVEMTVLGCYIQPSLHDRDKRLEQVAFFKEGLTQAKRMGVPIVGTETTRFDQRADPTERERAFARLKDSILRMVEHAEREHVIIGIEPVALDTLNTPELARRLLDEVGSDKLKIIFDPVNLVLPREFDQQEAIYTRVLDCLGSDIVAVHIKDVTIEQGEKVWQPIGVGQVRYALIFDWLRTNKPDMRLLREGVQMDSYAADRAAMEKLTKG
ncbi:MAG: sugar phosphate isomerase/epimerase [Oscillospiraceae bacterium]|nr:sugar phosphate isomerase/epimerase [Oscillospiraceae bacterium]